ncbi:hypothetical protein PVAP13_6NG324165 [Panicum virgatum]|uniref:Uncharacterized protein n=1 Tax=Panicum virgatum TaxID=38727 RepID=A0A8T0R4P6_PANVG|nr:hypothetical protein PVAP13_6NG324165 [Panicum virgatum]
MGLATPPPCRCGLVSPPLPALALYAHLTFIFDQLDAINRTRSSDLSARDTALHRIQSRRRPTPLLRRHHWRERQDCCQKLGPEPDEPKKEAEAAVAAGNEVGRRCCGGRWSWCTPSPSGSN